MNEAGSLIERVIMPTYEYKCPRCGYIIEVFHGISEKPVIKCPKCRECGINPETNRYEHDLYGPIMDKMIGRGSGVIFKGDGWTPKFHN